MDTPEFLGLFVTEAREHLESASALLARARIGPLNPEDVNALFRHAHSIKGMALSMGFRRIGGLAHAMEDRLQKWREGSAVPDAATLGLLVRACDRLAAQVDAAAGAREPEAEDDLVAALAAIAGAKPGSVPGKAGSALPKSGGATPKSAAGAAPPGAGRPVALEVVLVRDAPLPAARAAVIAGRLAEHGTNVVAHAAGGGAPAPGGTLRFSLDTVVDPARLVALVAALPDVARCRVAPAEAAAALSSDRRSRPRRAGERRKAAPRRRAAPSSRSKPADPAVARPAGGSPADPALPAGAGGRPAESLTAEPEASREQIGTIRVATDRMDHLLDGIGELILERERLKRALSLAPDSPGAPVLEALARTIDAVRHEVVAMRLLPFASVVPRLERNVRDLGERLGKRVALEVRGADVALDRSILEEMMDALQHILRNAIDHGIETAEVRRRAGKPEEGRVTIELGRREDRVGLVVTDDGRGIDPAALRRVAVERRFVTREAAARLSDEEALMLVTIPGFSTATRTTDISGRGVGMDVVRMRVQKLGGRLSIRSEVGAGTHLEIDLPPTVTVTRAFLCRAGDDLYAVPVAAVHATVEVRQESVQASHGERVVRRDGELVTVLSLLGLLAAGAAPWGAAAFPALVYRVDRRAYALAVDEIVGEQEIVVRPLRHPLELLPQYAGAAVLNDGRIALILDPVNLTRTARAA